jgi:hypothetical protein
VRGRDPISPFARYTGADCMEWMREAGFGRMRVEPLVTSQSMIVGFK